MDIKKIAKKVGLKQKDIFSEQQVYLDKVNSELSRREELERKRQEEERKRQIAAAWTILDVPYISQNKNNVLNGCEVASLLMGLQYKGYLRNMDLKTYAQKVLIHLVDLHMIYMELSLLMFLIGLHHNL